MATKRIKDLPTVTSPTAGDKIPLDGASTRAIVFSDFLAGLPVVANALSEYTAAKMAARSSLGLDFLKFRPEDSGCVGDGVANDTANFLTALGAAVAAGGTLYLRPGATYLLSAWTAYTTASTVRIIGNGATLKGPASTVVFFTPQTVFEIQGVTFDRWSSVISAPVAGTGSIDKARFGDNKITNCTLDTVFIERPLSNSFFIGNRFYSNTGGGAMRIGTNDQTKQDTFLNNKIMNNTITAQSSATANSALGIIDYGRNSLISGNQVDDVSNSSTGEAWGIYTKCRESSVVGNRIRKIKAASNTDCQGLSLKGSNRSNTVQGVQGFANVAVGNVITDVGTATTIGNGIHLQGEQHLVIGNTVDDCGVAGINMDDGRGSFDMQVIGNRILSTTISPSYGILCSASGSNYTIDDNSVRGTFATGIAVIPDTAALFRVSVKNNKITATTNAFRFNGFAFAINGMTFTGNDLVASVGVLNGAGGGTLSGLRFADNDFRNATTPWSGTVVGRLNDNIGYVTRSSGSSALVATGAGTAVTHGLSAAPATVLISCTSSSGLQFGVTARSSTTFTIQHSGGGSATFDWEAKLAVEDG